MNATRMEQQALLAFTVASWRLAVPLSEARRVVPLPYLQQSPGAPHFVEGYFDYLGEPVAAIRLDRLFGLEEERLGIYSPLIVLDVQGLGIALHVRRVDGILDGSAVQPIGRGETFNACVIGRLSEHGESIYVLSKDELLMAEERAKVAAHQATGQQRLDNLETQLAHAS